MDEPSLACVCGGDPARNATCVATDAGDHQQEVAEKLGRPQSFVAKVEGGERRLDVIEFIAVARALGADPVKMMRKLIGS